MEKKKRKKIQITWKEACQNIIFRSDFLKICLKNRQKNKNNKNKKQQHIISQRRAKTPENLA